MLKARNRKGTDSESETEKGRNRKETKQKRDETEKGRNRKGTKQKRDETEKGRNRKGTEGGLPNLLRDGVASKL